MCAMNSKWNGYWTVDSEWVSECEWVCMCFKKQYVFFDERFRFACSPLSLYICASVVVVACVRWKIEKGISFLVSICYVSIFNDAHRFTESVIICSDAAATVVAAVAAQPYRNFLRWSQFVLVGMDSNVSHRKMKGQHTDRWDILSVCALLYIQNEWTNENEAIPFVCVRVATAASVAIAADEFIYSYIETHRTDFSHKVSVVRFLRFSSHVSVERFKHTFQFFSNCSQFEFEPVCHTHSHTVWCEEDFHEQLK